MQRAPIPIWNQGSFFNNGLRRGFTATLYLSPLPRLGGFLITIRLGFDRLALGQELLQRCVLVLGSEGAQFNLDAVGVQYIQALDFAVVAKACDSNIHFLCQTVGLLNVLDGLELLGEVVHADSRSLRAWSVRAYV